MPFLITSLLVLAPFLVGLNRPLVWSLWATVLAGVFLWQAFDRTTPGGRCDDVRRPGEPVDAGRIAMLTLAAAFAFGLPLLQLAGGVCTALPSSTPCVTDTERTWLSLVFALLLWLWFLLLTSPGRPAANKVLIALAFAGGAQAVYALGCVFMGVTPLFLEHVYRHQGVPTGGFPNRNHFAAFMYVCIFATIALILRLPGDTGSGRAGRWRLLLDQRLLWRLLVIVMVLALVATRSRAGNAAFLIGLVAGFAWLMLVERLRAHSGRTQPLNWRFVALLLVSVVLLDTLLIGSFVGIDKVRERIADTTVQGEIRDNVNADLLAHPALFTAFGHGAASFEPAYARVKSADIGAHFDLAHNDYLQVLVERGWAGALLFAAALLLAGRQALRQQPNGSERGAEVRFALVAATVALLVQASVEYVTQVPALWLAWLALLALAVKPRAKRVRTL